MATQGLHWKWQSFTPCQRHPSEPIGKIFGGIDNVIDLNNLAKFGFGKIFPDGGTHTQHIRVRPFFITFYALWWGCSQNGWTDFDAQYAVVQSLALGIHKSVRLVRSLLDRNSHNTAHFVIAHMNSESQHAQLHHRAVNSATPSDIFKAVRCVPKLNLA